MVHLLTDDATQGKAYYLHYSSIVSGYLEAFFDFLLLHRSTMYNVLMSCELFFSMSLQYIVCVQCQLSK